jgi:two-component system, LuxR family, response regulator FixJ
MSGKATIYVIDDDKAVLRSLERQLNSAGYDVVSFDSPAKFLEAAVHLSQGCVLLDLRMPGLNGFQVQSALAKLEDPIPVIVITGQGDIQTAVRAMKAGAVDFLEKPFADERLLAAIEAALAHPGQAYRERDAIKAAGRLAVLSPRERTVLDALVAGHQNKMIAFDLGISVRTVEVHRARMMHRLGVRQLAEAVRLVVTAGFAPR